MERDVSLVLRVRIVRSLLFCGVRLRTAGIIPSPGRFTIGFTTEKATQNWAKKDMV